MTTEQAEVEAQKKAAADRALELVRPGTVVGLGSGSTARYFIAGLGDRVRAGLKVQAVATSMESRRLAEEGRIPITEGIDQALDLAVDGADEIDPTVNCLKGRGGALLREKIVAVASRRFVVIADESKLVGRLGRGPVPIEVLPFLWEATSRAVESLGGRPRLRMAASSPEPALCLGADMPFEYKVVHTVEEANQLGDEGFELFTILPPGPNGGPDRIYLRREKRRGQTPGFSRESKPE